MLIQRHKQATTTPKIRAAIQASTETAPVLAERFGVNVWLYNQQLPQSALGSKTPL